MFDTAYNAEDLDLDLDLAHGDNEGDRLEAEGVGEADLLYEHSQGTATARLRHGFAVGTKRWQLHPVEPPERRRATSPARSPQITPRERSFQGRQGSNKISPRHTPSPSPSPSPERRERLPAVGSSPIKLPPHLVPVPPLNVSEAFTRAKPVDKEQPWRTDDAPSSGAFQGRHRSLADDRDAAQAFSAIRQDIMNDALSPSRIDEAQLRRVLRDEFRQALEDFHGCRFSPTSDRSREDTGVEGGNPFGAAVGAALEEPPQLHETQAVKLRVGRPDVPIAADQGNDSVRDARRAGEQQRQRDATPAGAGANGDANDLSPRTPMSRASSSPFYKDADVDGDFSEGIFEWHPELERNFWKRLFHKYCAKTMVTLMRLKEPPRNTRVAKLLNSYEFETATAVVIIVNAIFTFFSTNREMEVALYGDDGDQSLNLFIAVMQIAFTLVYTMELCLKLHVHRWYFFVNEDWAWDLFDFVLVCTSLYDVFATYVLQLGSGDRPLNIVFMRALRVLKMGKILRLFRIMRFLRELKLILNCVLGSMPYLFWCCVMMALIFYMFALIFVNGTVTYFQEIDIASELKLDFTTDWSKLDLYPHDQLLGHFGSVQRAMLSMFKATTGGEDWTRFYDELQVTGYTNILVFIFFMAFTQIALVNIITGLFVDHAMKLAEPDHEVRFLDKRKAELQSVKEIEGICAQLDVDKNGYISDDEFKIQICKVGSKLRTYMGALGLDRKDAELFFSMLKAATLNQAVEIRAFVAGLLKLKGGATSLDMQALVFQTRLIHRRLDDLCVSVGRPADL